MDSHKTHTPGRKLTARQIFSVVYQGQRNFMTPEILRYFKTPSHAIELSKGRGIMGQAIYGVTIVDIPTMDRCEQSGKLFQSMTSALYYISDLKERDRLHKHSYVLWCQEKGESI